MAIPRRPAASWQRCLSATCSSRPRSQMAAIQRSFSDLESTSVSAAWTSGFSRKRPPPGWVRTARRSTTGEGEVRAAAALHSPHLGLHRLRPAAGRGELRHPAPAGAHGPVVTPFPTSQVTSVRYVKKEATIGGKTSSEIRLRITSHAGRRASETAGPNSASPKRSEARGYSLRHSAVSTVSPFWQLSCPQRVARCVMNGSAADSGAAAATERIAARKESLPLVLFLTGVFRVPPMRSVRLTPSADEPRSVPLIRHPATPL
jgi:hypothetical protein